MVLAHYITSETNTSYMDITTYQTEGSDLGGQRRGGADFSAHATQVHCEQRRHHILVNTHHIQHQQTYTVNALSTWAATPTRAAHRKTRAEEPPPTYLSSLLRDRTWAALCCWLANGIHADDIDKIRFLKEFLSKYLLHTRMKFKKKAATAISKRQPHIRQPALLL